MKKTLILLIIAISLLTISASFADSSNETHNINSIDENGKTIINMNSNGNNSGLMSEEFEKGHVEFVSKMDKLIYYKYEPEYLLNVVPVENNTKYIVNGTILTGHNTMIKVNYNSTNLLDYDEICFFWKGTWCAIKTNNKTALHYGNLYPPISLGKIPFFVKDDSLYFGYPKDNNYLQRGYADAIVSNMDEYKTLFGENSTYLQQVREQLNQPIKDSNNHTNLSNNSRFDNGYLNSDIDTIKSGNPIILLLVSIILSVFIIKRRN